MTTHDRGGGYLNKRSRKTKSSRAINLIFSITRCSILYVKNNWVSISARRQFGGPRWCVRARVRMLFAFDFGFTFHFDINHSALRTQEIGECFPANGAFALM